MGKGTNIQWCDDTINPTTGCDGCELHSATRKSCYAGALHEGRLARAMPALYAADFTEVRLAPGRMAKAAAASDLAGTARPGKPWLDGMPRVIFLGDMSDVFSQAVPFVYLFDEVIKHVTGKAGRRHIWMMLTKRPQRMAEFATWLRAVCDVPWPDNLWAGTSVTDRKGIPRVRHLLKVPAAVRFVSVEPLVEDIGFPFEFFGSEERDGIIRAVNPDDLGIPIDLLIVGGESDQGEFKARPFQLAWPRRILRTAERTDLKVFIKQLGSCPVGPYHERMALIGEPFAGTSNELVRWSFKDSHGGDWSEWPEDLKVRELPGPRKAVAS